MDKAQYFLGAEKEERLRLESQALLFEPFTARVLAAIGLRPGMTVLDIGTGAGDVALLAAQIFGPSCRVVSIDLNEAMVDHAQQRATQAGLTQVRFQPGALKSGLPLGPFDLVIGRFVTSFQADQISFLRTATSYVKPGVPSRCWRLL